MIYNARILNNLVKGRIDIPLNAIERKFILARKTKKLISYFRLILNILRRPRNYKASELKSFHLKDLYDNPYVRIERLDYLEHVTGIVSAPDLF